MITLRRAGGRPSRKLALIAVVLSLAATVVTAQVPSPSRSSPQVRWGTGVLGLSSDWYGSDEARSLADTVIAYQSKEGGWPKDTDLSILPRPENPVGEGRANTIDNNATTLPMRFLARVVQARDDPRYRQSFIRGLDYLFEAQYPEGGWPQFFPLRPGYYSRITFNDNAMVNVLSLLREVASGRSPFVFVDALRRDRARDAVARGIEIILRSQLKQGGKLTAWCAQHDEKTLMPAWARAYEPPSLSGNESAGIVRFLMGVEDPSPSIVAAVDAAVTWLQAVAVTGSRLEGFVSADGKKDLRLVADPNAPRLWARFYELETNRPIFLGRDSVVHYALSEIEHERRNGYAYYGVWAESLLAREYPRWRQAFKNQPLSER